MLLVRGVEPTLATAAAFCGGLLAGSITGVLHTKFKIHGLLAGILVMTALLGESRYHGKEQYTVDFRSHLGELCGVGRSGHLG